MSSLCCPEGKQTQSRKRDVLRCRQAGLSPPPEWPWHSHTAGGVDGEAACLGLRRPSRGGRRVCWGQDGAGSCLAPLSQCLAWALVRHHRASGWTWSGEGAFAAPQPHFPICQTGVAPCCLRDLGEE